MTVVQFIGSNGTVLREANLSGYPKISESVMIDGQAYKCYHNVHLFTDTHRILSFVWEPKPFADDTIDELAELVSNVYSQEKTFEPPQGVSDDSMGMTIYHDEEILREVQTSSPPHCESNRMEPAIVDSTVYTTLLRNYSLDSDENGVALVLSRLKTNPEEQYIPRVRRTLRGQSRKKDDELLQENPDEWERRKEE